jgi:hypothetical protein
MRPQKLKIEFYDPDGVRHFITMDGPVSRDKVARILDLVEVISGTPVPSPTALGLSGKKLDRLASSIISHLRDKPFTSTEAKKVFEKTYAEKIPLSTVSTYLSRLADRGLLARRPDADALRYCVTPGREQPLPGPPASSPQVS